jgi:hypothetical protein
VGRSAPGVHQQPRVAGLIEYARQQGQPWWDFDTQVGYIFKELGSSSLMVNGQSGAVRLVHSLERAKRCPRFCFFSLKLPSLRQPLDGRYMVHS